MDTCWWQIHTHTCVGGQMYTHTYMPIYIVCEHLYSHDSHIGLVDNEETAHYRDDEHQTNDVD